MIASPSRIFARQPIAGCFYWSAARDGDTAGYALFRRHYSARNKRPKQRQFVGPGEKMVLVGLWDDALFCWRKSIRDDGQTGICCTVFRNESEHRSSDMILEAERVALKRWPGQRMFTHVEPAKVRSANPGYCFKRAGWRLVRLPNGSPALTTNNLLIFEKVGGVS